MENEKIKKTLYNSLWYVLLTIITLAMALIVFRKYIFGGYAFVNQHFLTDVLRANIPAYKEYYRIIHNNGYFWSWNMGIGTSIFSHGDMFTDPFNIIIFLGNYSGIESRIIWSVIVKIVFAANFFYVYVSKFQTSKYASVIASIMYAFSGAMIILGSNLALAVVFVYAPLVFLGMENFLKKKRSVLLLVMLTLVGINSYYFLFIFGILCVIYLLFRMWMSGDKKVLNLLFRLFITGCLSVGIGAISIIPQVELALKSPRVADTVTHTWVELIIPRIDTLAVFLSRTMSNEVFGNLTQNNYVFINGSRDYFVEAGFISAFSIILISQLFSEKNNKRKYAVVASISLLLMISVPAFNYFTNAFKTITNRWFFFYALVVCLMIAQAIDFIVKNGINKKIFWISSAVSALFFLIGTNLRYLLNEDYSNFTITIRCIFFDAVIILIAYKAYSLLVDKHKRILFFVLVCLIAADTVFSYTNTFNSEYAVMNASEEISTDYTDTSATLIDKIKAFDNTFYRINKDFDPVYDGNSIPSLNDAMVQNYYGIKNYNSLPNANYIKFQVESDIYSCIPFMVGYYKSIGLLPNQLNSQELNFTGACYDDKYGFLNFMGIKYYITKSDGAQLPGYYESIDTDNGVSVYENKHYLPLAIIKKGEISYEEYKSLSSDDKERIIQASTIIPEGEEAVSGKIFDLTEDDYSRLQNSFNVKNFRNDKIEFEMNFDDDHGRYISFSIPYDSDWHVSIDGVEVATKLLNVSLLGVDITDQAPGKHEIVLIYIPSAFYMGMKITVAFVILTIVLWVFGTVLRAKNISLACLLGKAYMKILLSIKSMSLSKFNTCILLLMQLVILLFFVSRGNLRYIYCDDTIMVSLASGGYGVLSAKLLNIHVLVGYLLKLLYSIVGSVNWNTVLYIVFYFSGFWGMDYALSRLMAKKESKQIIVVYTDIAILVMSFLLLRYFTFTVLAYSLLIGGLSIILIALYGGFEKNKLLYIFGIVLLILAALIRHDVIKTAAIFLFLFAIVRFIFYRREKKLIVLDFALLFLMGVVYISNGLLIGTDAESKAAREWGETRSAAVDCQLVPYNSETFDEVGISEADYYAMYNGFYYIRDAVSNEKFEELQRLNSLKNKYNVDVKSIFFYVLERIKYSLHVNNYQDIYLTLFFVALLVNLLFCNKKGKAYSILALFGTCGLDVLYYVANRNPYHIVMPTYAMGIVTLCFILILFLEKRDNSMSELQRIICSILVISVIAQGVQLYKTRDVASEKWLYSEARHQVLQYIQKNNDKLFIAGDLYTFNVGLTVNMWQNEAQDYNWNFIGNWEIYSKASNGLTRLYGVDPYNVGLEAVNSDCIRVITSVEPSFIDSNGKYIKQLFKQYYDTDIELIKDDEIITIPTPYGSTETWATYRIVTE